MLTRPSSYLLAQVKEYAEFCKSAALEQKVSCIWANDVQQQLVEYTTYDERLYWKLGPKNVADLYLPFHGENKGSKNAIRKELEQFNQLKCPHSSNQIALPSNTCQSPPPVFCLGADDGIYMLRTVAVSNECVLPTLVRLRSQMEKQVSRLHDAERAKHARWLFYVLFALLAGGKVANATAKFTKVRSGIAGLGDRQNTRGLVIATWRALRIVGRFLNTKTCYGYRLIKRASLWIWCLPKNVSAKTLGRCQTDAKASAIIEELEGQDIYK